MSRRHRHSGIAMPVMRFGAAAAGPPGHARAACHGASSVQAASCSLKVLFVIMHLRVSLLLVTWLMMSRASESVLALAPA